MSHREPQPDDVPVPLGPAVVGVLVTTLVPLVLILLGQLRLPDVVVCYAIEAAAFGVVRLLPALRGWTRLAAVVMPAILAAAALERVDWSVGSVLSIALTSAVAVANLVLALVLARRRDDRPAERQPVRMGAYLWRLAVLLMGGVVGLSYATDLERLEAHGWTPGTLADAPAAPFGRLFDHVVLGLGLAPLSAAALVLLVFKLVNELLYEVYDGVRDRTLLESRPAAR